MGGIEARRRSNIPVYDLSLKSMDSKICKILLAEDNPGDVFLVRRALNEALKIPEFSYTLQLAKDGEEAIRLLERSEADLDRIDLVLLDLNLPRRNGVEVLGHLNALPHLGSTPTIIMTSSDSPVDRERCLDLGASYYFRKPTELASFMEIGKIALNLIERARCSKQE